MESIHSHFHHLRHAVRWIERTWVRDKQGSHKQGGIAAVTHQVSGNNILDSIMVQIEQKIT